MSANTVRASPKLRRSELRRARRRGEAGAPHERETAGYRCRAAEPGRLALIRRRRPAHDLAEPPAERTQTGKPHGHADLGDRQVRRAQQLAGTLDPPTAAVPAWRLA